MVLRGFLAIGIIAAIVVSGFFYKNSLDQNRSSDSISAQIRNNTNLVTIATSQTNATQVEITDLTRRFAAAQSAIAAEKEKMPDKMNPNGIVREIMQLGATSEVTVIPLNAREWAAVKVDKGNYAIFKMSIEVNGEREHVVEFIRKLQSDLYTTLVIESASLTNPSTSASGETEIAIPALEDVTAELNLAIYAK